MGKNLKYVFLVSCITAIAYSLANIYLIIPSFTNLLISNTEDEAVRAAHHLSPIVVSESNELKMPKDFAGELTKLKYQFNLEKLKVFKASGEIIYSTDPKEIGQVNEKSYFHGVVAKGHPYTKIVQKNKKSLEDKVVTADVVETYVPLMIQEKFIGAFEIYYDITERNSMLNQVVYRSSLITLALILCFLFFIIVILLRTDNSTVVLSSHKQLRRYQSPLYQILILALSVFVAELFVMLLLSSLKQASPLVEALFDSFLLVLLVSPAFYFFLLRPLLYHITERQRSETELRMKTDQLLTQSSALKRAHSEMETLYEVSRSISRSITMDELLPKILSTIVEMELFRLERKGAIFLTEGERLLLASSIGFSESSRELHSNMMVGDCLCGLAATTGEVVVSHNCHKDERHTIRYPGMSQHGHIVVPLNAANRIAGVLCLYIPPDVEVEERTVNLLRSIGNQIGVAIENAKLYEETKALSLHDPLTGLANRRFLDLEMARNFAVTKRYGKQLSVIMLDIDHFKQFNDTHGHAGGDQLLVKIANILLREIRGSDCIVRYGGEEFLILLPETALAMASGVAERIRKAVCERTEGTVSLGVSSYNQAMLEEGDLIKQADNALYRAKEKGRNRVEVAPEIEQIN